METVTRQEMDRQFLINHLCDVRALEMAKIQLAQRIQANAKKINALGKPQVIPKPFSTGARIAVALAVMIAVFQMLTMILLLLYTEAGVDLKLLPILIIVCIGIVVMAGAVVGSVTAYKTYRGQKIYNEQLEKQEQRIAVETQQRQAIINQNRPLIEKHKEAIAILADSYAINMIPIQFRTPEGVAYLYDFMSTSQESLQSAMLNYNSETMKRQLDSMMQMQSEMIRQQHITNQNLEVTKQQNEEMIQRLKTIEGNSAQAAKYSSMTAINTRTIAFIQSVDFLRR